MRSINSATLLLIVLVTLLLLTACSKEETSSKSKANSSAIQSAEQVAAITDVSIGQKIYERSCAYCHTTGHLDAPRLGDRKAWSRHSHLGLDHMVKNAIFGIGEMPPKGGDHRLSDEQVRLAVVYIIEKTK